MEELSTPEKLSVMEKLSDRKELSARKELKKEKWIGIMQPYFLPYIGYWQLMKRVDRYVIYDDVDFIKGGWINRNRIISPEGPMYLNVPLSKPGRRKICEIALGSDESAWSRSVRAVELAYRRAPYFADVFPMYEQVMRYRGDSIADFIENSFRVLMPYLGIDTPLVRSSGLDNDKELRGQDKIIQICCLLGGTDYCNAIGGMSLYERTAFEKEGLRLHFLQTKPMAYRQLREPFWPNLSILDVMMFNSREELADMLGQYELV